MASLEDTEDCTSLVKLVPKRTLNKGFANDIKGGLFSLVSLLSLTNHTEKGLLPLSRLVAYFFYLNLLLLMVLIFLLRRI